MSPFASTGKTTNRPRFGLAWIAANGGSEKWGLKQFRGYLSSRRKAFFLHFLDFPGALRAQGLARHRDASRQKLSPHCLKKMFDSQSPSPKLSPNMPPELPLPHKRGLFSCFRIASAVSVIARQCLPRDIKMSLLAHWIWKRR